MPNKAIAGGGAVGVSGAIVTLFLAYFGAPTGHGVSPEVFAAALTTIVSIPVTYASIWITKMEGSP